MAKQQTVTAEVTKKSFLKDIVIKFGVLEATVNLYSPKKTNAGKEEQLHYACPLCARSKKGVQVKQFYSCPDHPTERWLPADCERVTDDGVLVNAETARAVKAASEAPTGTLSFEAFSVDSVSRFLVPDGGAYVLRPSGASRGFYDLLQRILGDDGVVESDNGPVVLVAEMTVRKNDKLFALGRWGDDIIVRSLVYPEDLDEFPEPSQPEQPVDDRAVVLAKTFIGTNTQDFKPTEFKRTIRERYAEMIEAAKDGVVFETPVYTPKNSTEDLVALLEASLPGRKENR